MGFALSDMRLTSAAFADGERIPARHTCEGDDVSPGLIWTNAPEDTREFALVCHDPDAPLIQPGTYGYVHWVYYNIPGSVSGLPEANDEYTNGVTDFGDQKYGGPAPPPGHGDHRYFFTLFALNNEMSLEAGLSMWELLEKIEPNVVGMNRLMGTYSR